MKWKLWYQGLGIARLLCFAFLSSPGSPMASQGWETLSEEEVERPHSFTEAQHPDLRVCISTKFPGDAIAAGPMSWGAFYILFDEVLSMSTPQAAQHEKNASPPASGSCVLRGRGQDHYQQSSLTGTWRSYHSDSPFLLRQRGIFYGVGGPTVITGVK